MTRFSSAGRRAVCTNESQVGNPYTNPDEPGFNPAYRGTPPWDIGRPQPDIVRLEEAGEIQGSVLDVGCGTGENVLYLASRGHDAWGVDLAPLAIEIARRKSAERSIQGTFIVADVFDLRKLGRSFDTVVDSGLLHIFPAEQRTGFAASLAEVLRSGGTYFVLGYSADDPGPGPRGFSPGDLRVTFAEGWRINYIRATQFAINDMAVHKSRAWLASISRD
jgi:SAM-dependent methyltransferase